MKEMSKRTIGLLALAILALGALGGAVAAAALDREDDEAPEAWVAPEAATTIVEPGGQAAVEPGSPALGEADDRPHGEADDSPLGEAEAAAVARAALRIAGGGTVTDMDRSDDVGEAYEVEVQTPAGEIDIALDADLERVPNLRYDD